ncbi:MAG: hypothetical protein ACYS0G_15480 [Planctomycetota bacterium]|jgi:hypothetical protein
MATGRFENNRPRDLLTDELTFGSVWWAETRQPTTNTAGGGRRLVRDTGKCLKNRSNKEAWSWREDAAR